MSLFSPFGRISRSSWWTVQLINFVYLIIVFILFIVPEMDSFNSKNNAAVWNWVSQNPSSLMPFALSVWVNNCANIKRYHDRGKSGFWILVILVPYIGALWQLIELGAQGGTTGSNAFGEPVTAGFRTINAQHQNSSTSNAAWNGNMDDAIAHAAADFKKNQAKPTAKTSPPNKTPPSFGKAPTTGFGRRGLS